MKSAEKAPILHVNAKLINFGVLISSTEFTIFGQLKLGDFNWFWRILLYSYIDACDLY